MSRILTLAVLVTALAVPAAHGAATVAQPPETRMRPDPRATGACPVELGPADAVAWYRLGSDARRRSFAALVATPLAPGGGIAALERVRGVGGCPSGAGARDGAALLVFLRSVDSDEDEGAVMAVDRPVQGGLGTPQRLSRSSHGRSPSAALGAGGAALVAWLGDERTDSSQDARQLAPLAVVRDPGGDFGAPVALGPAVPALGVSDDAGPAVGIDDAGNAFVAWAVPVAGAEDDDDPPHELWAASRPAGAAFGAPRSLGQVADVEALHVRVAPTGEALVVVDAPDGVRLATGTARDGVGSPTLLAGPVAGLSAVEIAPGGAAIVAWAQGGGNRHGTWFDRIVTVDRANGSAPFGAPRTLVVWPQRRGLEDLGELRLALADDGRALALWQEPRRIRDRIENVGTFVAHGRVGSAWERAVDIASRCRPPADALPAFGRDGQPRVTLLDNDQADGGDFVWPHDTRVRTMRFGARPSADRTPPRIALRVRARQRWARSITGRVAVRLRCSEDCDVHLFAIAGRGRDLGGGLFPRRPRLRADRTRRVVLSRTTDVFDDSETYDAGGTTRVRIVAHACDAAGNLARASARVAIAIDRDDYDTWNGAPPGS